MTDRPILFSAPMVRALLDGSKTQTRRAIKPGKQPSLFDGTWSDEYVLDPGNAEWRARDVRFATGDRLWVRESYYQRGQWDDVAGVLTKGGRQKRRFVPDDDDILFVEADDATLSDWVGVEWHKRLGRFMPRRYSRLTLLVTDVRVQRLQDCSEADALAEGVTLVEESLEDPVEAYAALWGNINGPGAWEANPWVVAVSFDVKRGNIDHSEGE